MIKIESGSFAALVRSYKKSLNMLAVLQHICQENDVALSMLPDEVCELINLDPAEIEKQRLSGRLRFAEEENGTKHYSIVDIISVAVCVDNLGVDDIVVSELYEGSGHVHCQHGMMPVPVPATANIVAANHLPMKITDAQGEMVTPTGAAIAAALRTQDHLPEDYQLLKIGLGAGKKDFPKANVLRAMLLETKDQPQTGEEEDIWKLESNIDDCSGEVLGYTMERLLAAGARDVCYAPIYMKKNRPAYMLHVLCDRRQIPAMEEIIFNETTTIGIRRYKVERTILKRHEAKAKTAYGEVELKICEKNGIVYRYPEYESVKKLCEAAGVPFKVVYQAACEAEISE